MEIYFLGSAPSSFRIFSISLGAFLSYKFCKNILSPPPSSPNLFAAESTLNPSYPFMTASVNLVRIGSLAISVPVLLAYGSIATPGYKLLFNLVAFFRMLNQY